MWICQQNSWQEVETRELLSPVLQNKYDFSWLHLLGVNFSMVYTIKHEFRKLQISLYVCILSTFNFIFYTGLIATYSFLHFFIFLYPRTLPEKLLLHDEIIDSIVVQAMFCCHEQARKSQKPVTNNTIQNLTLFHSQTSDEQGKHCCSLRLGRHRQITQLQL